MHVVDGILRRNSVNARVAGKAICVIAVSLDEIGIPIAEALCRVLRIVQHRAIPDVDHAPIVQLLALVFPGCRRLTRRGEGKVWPAVQHDMTHFLSGVIAMHEIDRVAVVQLDAVFVKLLRNCGDVIVQNREIREIVPAEVRTEQDHSGDARLCDLFRASADAVKRVGVRIVQILPFDPPVDKAVAREQLGAVL